MSEAKFTPGPWKFHRWEDECWRVLGTTASGLEGCYSVAEVIDGNGHPQNEANARLIAAAPELLEALQSVHRLLTEAWRSGLLPATVIPAEVSQSCAEAIAKATGG